MFWTLCVPHCGRANRLVTSAMQAWNETEHLSNRPDVAHLRFVEIVQSICLTAVAAITFIVLAWWFLPSADAVLPDIWSTMNANTALGLLLCALGVVIGQRSHAQTTDILSLGAGLAAATLAAGALVSHLTGYPSWLDAWSVVGVDSTENGRMSIAAALYLLPTGLAIAAWSLPIRKWQRLAEALATLTLAQALIMLGAHVFGAWSLFQGGEKALTDTLTLVSIILLTSAVMIRHLRSGMYQLIIGLGIGSAFLRIGLPWMFVLPFLIVLVALATVQHGGLDIRYTAALTAAFASLTTLLFSLNIAKKLNGLEAELRSQSLTDPLTGLHNRRGFEILGEQRFHEAKRSRENVALLFFDIDGLKQVNDRFGHDVGSRLIKDFADLLTHKFRHSDVLGRLGGDEFAVLVHDGDDAEACVKQLEQAAETTNIESSRPYVIEFSVGIEYGSPRTGDTLLDLITRADNSMYLRKRAKRESSRWLGDTAAVDPAR